MPVDFTARPSLARGFAFVKKLPYLGAKIFYIFNKFIIETFNNFSDH